MSPTTHTPPRSPEVQADLGREARADVPLEAHAGLSTEDRPDPVAVLADQIPGRVRELIPLRHARMLASPFAFYRGGAAVMAADLARLPSSGLTVQLCGDAHLSNFGMFASPERRMVFDVNDFDETLPGPFEWDVKRLAASIVVASRQNGFSPKKTQRAVLAALRRYQTAMASFAGMGNLEVWYAGLDVAQAEQDPDLVLDKAMRARLDKSVRKARGRNHLRSLGKLTEVVDGHRRFRADPPLLVPLRDVLPEAVEGEMASTLKAMIQEYAASLEPGVRELVRSYDFVDMARKVVGVGSVGTRCWVVMMLGRDENDPLFLQVKEAQPSVLSAHLGQGVHRNQGARVVAGQRIMQASGDIFLGSHRVLAPDGVQRDFYIRQLQDWKGSLDVERMVPHGLRAYAETCAWTLARAHARSGDRIAIAAYLGDDDVFAESVARFATSYAALNDRDFARFGEAVESDEFLGQPAVAEVSRPRHR
jgi:uncharacterized protein (DUF2252 family)